MAGYKGKTGKRATRVKLLIYEHLVQNPKGLTTAQLFDRISSSSVGRYCASPAALSQVIRVVKGVEKIESEYISTGSGDNSNRYMVSVWVMADPKAFLDWYGEDII